MRRSFTLIFINSRHKPILGTASEESILQTVPLCIVNMKFITRTAIRSITNNVNQHYTYSYIKQTRKSHSLTFPPLSKPTYNIKKSFEQVFLNITEIYTPLTICSALIGCFEKNMAN